MVASSAVSVGIAVHTGVRELQVLASLVAYRLEQATGAPGEPALVKKLAIDLYLDPKRTLDLADERLRLLRLTRKWRLERGLRPEDVEAGDEGARCRGATRRGCARRALARAASAQGRVGYREQDDSAWLLGIGVAGKEPTTSPRLKSPQNAAS